MRGLVLVQVFVGGRTHSMNARRDPTSESFRVWIVECQDGRPAHWSERPSRARALRPLENSVYSHEEAMLLVEGFNDWIVQNRLATVPLEDRRWAIAVPVRVMYEGDLVPGDEVSS
jgi:hypothetical protein